MNQVQRNELMRECCRQWQATKDPQAMETIIRETRGLAVMLVRRWRKPWAEEDYMQEAMVAIINAANQFNPDHESGASFAVYAFRSIRRQLRSYKIQREAFIRVPQARVREFMEAVADHRSSNPGSPSPETVTGKYGIDEVAVQSLMDRSTKSTSLTMKTAGDSESMTLEEWLGVKYAVDDHELHQGLIDAKEIIARLHRKMKGKERLVLDLLLEGPEHGEWVDLAREQGVSRQRIHQVLKDVQKAVQREVQLAG